MRGVNLKYRIELIDGIRVNDTWLINALYNKDNILIGICVDNSGVLFEVKLSDIKLKTIEQYYG